MGEEEYEISDWLKDQCSMIWNIRNKLSDAMDEACNEPHTGRLERMRAYVRDWSRQDMIDYHMGNIFTQGHGNNGSIKWALENGTSKIKAINRILENGTPMDLATAKRDLDCINNILSTANGKDGIQLALIENDLNYWRNMTDEELFEI